MDKHTGDIAVSLKTKADWTRLFQTFEQGADKPKIGDVSLKFLTIGMPP